MLKKIISLLVVLQLSFGGVFFFFPSTAFAATGVPTIIAYQGRLTDSSGNLLGGSSGTSYYFKFSIYDNATVGSGSKLWPTSAPTATSTKVTSGVFNFDIGDTASGYPDTLDYNFQDNKNVFLQVEVSSDGVTYETLAPRQRITSAGFAINAGTLVGYTPSQNASGNQIPVLSNNNLWLTGNNPQINATSTNALVLQGAATGDIMFFASSTKITSGGNATFAGTLTVGSSTILGGQLSFTGTTHAGLKLNNLTTAERDAITAATGMTIFNTTLGKVQAYTGSTWTNVGSTAIGGDLENSTPGSILFAGAGSLLAQDNANLFYSTSTVRLGIGTAAPSSTLHVVGTLQVSATSTLSGHVSLGTTSSTQLTVSGNTNLSTLQTSGAITSAGSVSITGGDSDSYGQIRQFRLYNGGTERMWINTDAGPYVYLNTNSLGLIMSSAGSSFQLRSGYMGNTSDSNFVATKAGYTLSIDGAGATGDSGWVKSSETGGNFSTKYDGTEVQRFSSATNAAFGTNLAVGGVGLTASTTLHVVGTFMATASSTFSSAGASKIAYLDASSTLTSINIGSNLTLSGDTLSAVSDGNDPFKWIANSTDLYASSTYTKVGIGTTAPSSTLHVVGTMTVTGTSTLSGPTYIDDLNLGMTTFDTNAGVVSWIDLPVTSSAASGTVQSYTAKIDDNDLLSIYAESDGAGGINNGRVGIGTSVPSSTLHVVGTLQATGTSTLSGHVSLGTTSSTQLTVSGNTNLSTLDTSGAITTSASYVSIGGSGSGVLYLNGTSGLSSRVSYYYPNLNMSGIAFSLRDNNTGADRVITRIHENGMSLNSPLGAAATFSVPAIYGSVIFDGDGNPNSGNSYIAKTAATGGNFSTYYDATEVQRFSSATNAAFGTNLAVGGVGLTASTTLHVVGTFKATASSTFSSAGASKIAYLDASSTLTSINIGSNLTLSGDTLSAVSDGNDPYKWIANSTDLYASSTYTKVGIGTTAPSSTLHVVGTMTVSGTSTLSGPTIIDDARFGSLAFDSDAGSVSWFDLPVTSAATAGTVQSYSAQIDGNPLLTIYSESDGAGGIRQGSVSVGTSTPAGLFSVGSSTMYFTVASSTGNVSVTNTLNVSSTMYVTGAAAFGSTLQLTGAASLLSTLAVTATTTLSSSLVVDTNSLYVDASSNSVGIGTTAPSSTLHVVGTFAVTSTSTFTGGSTYISDLYSGANIFAGDSGQVTWIDMPVSSAVTTSTIQSITANVAGNPLLTLYGEAAGGLGGVTTSTLRVGIGTKFPSSTLHVVGGFQVGASNIYVSSTTGFVGLGTATPSSTLHVVGTFQVTATSTFSGGQTIIDDLVLGATNFEADAGIISWVDMPVSSSAASGTVESYSAKIDGNDLVTLYSTSDGAGGTNSRRVGINTNVPSSTLHVVGTMQVTGTSTLANVNATVITASGAVNASSTLSVTGATSLGSTLQLTGAASLLSTLTVSGAINASSTLSVTGATSLGSTLQVTGATNLLSTLNVTGTTTLSGPTIIDDLNLGEMSFAADSGIVALFDMPVTSNAAASTSEAYWLNIDGNTLANFYAESDGAGGIQRSGVAIGTSNTPSTTLHIVGTLRSTATTTLATAGGMVGIGTTAPSSTLHVVGTFQVTATSTFSGGQTIIDELVVGASTFDTDAGIVSWMDMPVTASSTSGTVMSYGAQLDGNRLLTLYGLSDGAGSVTSLGVAVGTSTAPTMFYAYASGSIAGSFDRGNSDGTIVSLLRDGVEQGTISVTTGTVSYNAFTGSHYVRFDDPNSSSTKGQVMVMTGNNAHLNDDPTNELIYGIKQSDIENSPAVLGSYLGNLSDEKDHSVELVMAAGNGDVWITDTGTDIAVGDNLITSAVAGHARLDPRTAPVSHVFAKASETIKWSDVTDMIDGVKHAKIVALYGNFDRDNAIADATILQATGSVDASAVTGSALKDLTMDGNLVVKGIVTFNADTVGEAVIMPGSQTVYIEFAQEYKTVPVITVTPEGAGALAEFRYAVMNKTTKGFNIDISSNQPGPITFNWHSFASAEDAKIFVSDGTSFNLQIGIETPAASNPVIVAPDPIAPTEPVVTPEAPADPVIPPVPTETPGAPEPESTPAPEDAVIASEGEAIQDSAPVVAPQPAPVVVVPETPTEPLVVVPSETKPVVPAPAPTSSEQ